ncbi:pantetheine-phosphate adenylyltransferase [Clostridium sp. JN-1]|jgi:pantetheine-phosphate adenylyltransferase|uniref:pantetheine-phosphate adenylyltransferase n=1 Tax=Clostridium sp. JN-1 TaxID=2483110 RepID=UPI000F0BC074|nr:pantetheine-phosphate adenylyltransferase [Clostridium sp. JN-1]
MRVAVYPGSFDPITNGHLDIIKRSCKVFDKVIVAVLVNPDKKGLFTIEGRVELIKKVVRNIPNVEVESFNGLLINFMKEKNSKIIIKGLRAVSDFEYEFQMSLMNQKLDPEIETVFMMTSAANSFLSSSSVKQVAMFGGCIKDLVPEEIIPYVLKRVKEL